MNPGGAGPPVTSSSEAALPVPTAARPASLAWIRLACLAVSLALCLGASVVYWLRPSPLAALAVFPCWVILAPGLVLLRAGWSRRTWRPSTVVLLAWLVFALAFVEEPRSLLRRRPGPPAAASDGPAGNRLRVASLNCYFGTATEAAEPLAYSPDVILLQESPGRPAVEAAARRCFGARCGFACGPDVSIMARGSVAPVPDGNHSFFSLSRVDLEGGPSLWVANVHLHPNPAVRLDLWKPSAWREQAQRDRLRRDEMRQLVLALEALPPGPLVVAGDFNVPPGDAVFRLLPSGFRDAWGTAGCGWGPTFPARLPLVRIDQVWTNPDLQAVAAWTARTPGSDHRMLLCDLALR